MGKYLYFVTSQPCACMWCIVRQKSVSTLNLQPRYALSPNNDVNKFTTSRSQFHKYTMHYYVVWQTTNRYGTTRQNLLLQTQTANKILRITIMYMRTVKFKIVLSRNCSVNSLLHSPLLCWALGWYLNMSNSQAHIQLYVRHVSASSLQL